ncbi:MAG TPA: prolyl oligopeptidase family serine peptidase [Cyclobacteriaceae bacterium]|nr:prolyl oligopeptidase family serine peptidase [Cyclobacteriaceae bacterium]
MKKILLLLFIGCTSIALSQTLTVEKIMRDPKWMGAAPSNIFWSEDSKQVYFNWNPDKNAGDSLYTFSLTNRVPQKVNASARKSLPSVNGIYNKARSKKLYDKNGDIFLLDLATGKSLQITSTTEREFNPTFSGDGKKILFTAGMNLYSLEIATGSFSQLTDFRKGTKKSDPKLNDQEKWLKNDQLSYFDVLKDRYQKRKAGEAIQKTDRPKRPREIYTEEKTVDQIQLSPDGKFVTYRLTKSATAKNTIVPNYVTESGFTEDIPARTKVGAPLNSYEMMVYNIENDTVLAVKTTDIPGIFDIPAFRKDYPSKPSKEGDKEKKPAPRSVVFFGPLWSEDGKHNIVVARAQDNKDRWLLSLDVQTQKLSVIDRQHDDAWVGGPGAGFGAGAMGWLSNQQVWFQSEETGYAHLYVYDFTTGKKQAITSGNYEVQTVDVSKDKKFFYVRTNEVHAGEQHFYRISVTGGKAEKLTTMTGSNQVTLSPDEKWMAILYSYSNKPWEIYLQENTEAGKPTAKAQQITSSLSEEFKSYPWRDPELVTFKARDGADVYTRVYRPVNPNGAAVIFVHGAGYLQNAHKWWSSYFREYMFHNLLADQGYTVLDMDYRGSAGYGRDWRTGIYRFMGGKDLTDHVDGAKWMVEKYNIDPKRIGIYGGSYGGFITLMGMFTTPDVFAAGAALRPVTDWAHYNHGYTSNILNEPTTDSIAYAKSSPLYHAAGLKGHLLICHGMVDVNVHFEDAVRVTQRLIELGKDNWELAVYPVEDHGFVEPSSWTDEYKRILKLFETYLR